jgi:Zn-dependent peptidase ImmA (M78 family)/transcriptional regulator with XRE-family HTH domain
MRYESVDLSGLAERLVAARKGAGIKQEEAAKHLDISRPTFIAIEKGHRRPRPEELVRLAGLYKVPLNNLLRSGAGPRALRPHLRSVLDTSAGAPEGLEEAVTVLAGYIDDYQYLENLLEARPTKYFPPLVRVGPGPIERFAEHCAQEERARLNLGAHQPVHTLRKVLEEVGLHVFMQRLHPNLAGLYVFVPDFGYCILVNAVHPRERRRWTIAHEYGHFLVDRERPGVDYSKAMHRKPEGERFADSFAAAFLMPEAGVQRRFYEDIERSGDFRVGDLCRMADYFAVSVMAMALRLEALGVIPRGSWDKLSESRVPISELKKGAGVGSGDDGDSDRPYPERYRLLAVQAFADGKLTEGQLAKLLRCSRIEARGIVQEISTADDDEAGQSCVPLTLADSLLANAPS